MRKSRAHATSTTAKDEGIHRSFFLSALCSNGGDFFSAIDTADSLMMSRLKGAPAKPLNEKCGGLRQRSETFK
jgi:hypothetical protein